MLGENTCQGVLEAHDGWKTAAGGTIGERVAIPIALAWTVFVRAQRRRSQIDATYIQLISAEGMSRAHPEPNRLCPSVF